MMIAQSPRKPGHHTLMVLLVLAALIGLVSLMALQQLPQIQVPLSEHALEVHGSDAQQAKGCMEGRTGFLFWNPQTQRWAVWCWLGDRWGVVILTSAWLVITAFVVSKLKTVKRMREYMRRNGYQER